MDALDSDQLTSDDLTDNKEEILPLPPPLLPSISPPLSSLPLPPCTLPPQTTLPPLPPSSLPLSASPMLLPPTLPSSVLPMLLSPALPTPSYAKLEDNIEELLKKCDHVTSSTPLSPSISPLLLPP